MQEWIALVGDASGCKQQVQGIAISLQSYLLLGLFKLNIKGTPIHIDLTARSDRRGKKARLLQILKLGT